VGLENECDLPNLYKRPPRRFASTNPAKDERDDVAGLSGGFSPG
jgi:hypothetical protein